MAIHFSKQEFENRKKNVLESMQKEKLDALLMFRQESMYWLTGYDTFGFVYFQCLTFCPFLTSIFSICIYRVEIPCP